MKPILEQLNREYKSLLAGMGVGSRPANFIGLDIGSRYYRAVRIRKTGSGFSPEGFISGKKEDLAGLKKRMSIKDEEELCVNFKIEGMVIRRVSIPAMPQGEVEGALKWELKEHSGPDADKARIRFSILGERETEDGAKRIELIAFLYQESDVESKVKELKEAGLNVKNVMPMDFAIARYVNNLKIAGGDALAAVVDIGSVKTNISIIEKDKVCFTREIAIGGDTITEAMTGIIISDRGRMELSWEEAEKMKIEIGIPSDIKMLAMIRPILEKLASQIKGSLEYYEHYFNEGCVKRIILAGSGSRLKGLKEYIVKETGLDIVTILPEEAGAAGLAMSMGSNMNILPDQFKLEDKKALKNFFAKLAVVVFGFLLLFSYALLCMKAVNLKREAKIKRQHLDTLAEIRLLKDKVAAYSSVMNTISSDDINAGRIMKEISNLVFSDMALDRFTIDAKEPNIIMGGTVSQQDSLTGFMSRLESDALFQNVKLSFSEKKEGPGSSAVNFEITCNVRRK